MADSGTPVEPGELSSAIAEGRAWDATAAQFIYLTTVDQSVIHPTLEAS